MHRRSGKVEGGKSNDERASLQRYSRANPVKPLCMQFFQFASKRSALPCFPFENRFPLLPPPA